MAFSNALRAIRASALNQGRVAPAERTGGGFLKSLMNRVAQNRVAQNPAPQNRVEQPVRAAAPAPRNAPVTPRERQSNAPSVTGRERAAQVGATKSWTPSDTQRDQLGVSTAEAVKRGWVTGGKRERFEDGTKAPYGWRRTQTGWVDGFGKQVGDDVLRRVNTHWDARGRQHWGQQPAQPDAGAPGFAGYARGTGDRYPTFDPRTEVGLAPGTGFERMGNPAIQGSNAEYVSGFPNWAPANDYEASARAMGMGPQGWQAGPAIAQAQQMMQAQVMPQSIPLPQRMGATTAVQPVAPQVPAITPLPVVKPQPAMAAPAAPAAISQPANVPNSPQLNWANPQAQFEATSRSLGMVQPGRFIKGDVVNLGSPKPPAVPKPSFGGQF